MKKILLLILSLGFAAALCSGCFASTYPGDSSSGGGGQASSSIDEGGASSTEGSMEGSSSVQEDSSSATRTFTLVFRQPGRADIVRQVKEGGSLQGLPKPEQKTGYTITWNVTDFSNITQDLIIDTVETPNTYTITYDAGEGKSSITTQTVTYDKVPGDFATATREGYSFICWEYNGKAIQPTEIWQIADDVTLVAKWVPITIYTVSFVQEDAETISIPVEVGSSLQAKDIPVPQAKEGYTVTWEDKDLTNIQGNITVNAVATANTYTITYDADEGTASMETQTVTYDKAPESFATATRDGYSFVAWTYNGKAVQPTETWRIAEDVTLIATWLPVQIYTVSFIQSGWPTIMLTAEEGGAIDKADIPAPQAKEGYTVTWEDKDLTNITDNIVVNAVVTPNTYTITYDAGDGTPSVATQEVTYDKAPESLATATLFGYSFVCWTYNGKALVATEAWRIADDVTLVAKWAPVALYTVNFVQDGEETISVLVEEGSSLKAADIPTPKAKDGYILSWEKVDLTNIRSNITVRAIAVPSQYTITYDAGGGTASQPTQTVTYNQIPESFATATREGYKFKGWAYEGEMLSDTLPWKIADDVTLTAVWAKIYTVTLNTDGGKLDTTTMTVVEGEAYSLPIPSKLGFAFNGWYFGSTKLPQTDVWRWTAEEHTITLKADWIVREWTNDY